MIGHRQSTVNNSNTPNQSEEMTRALRNSITSDPAVLLARGYTGRYLGAVLDGSITTLTNEEIDKDLKHIAAYQEAADRFQQVTFAATHSNSTSGITEDTFPTRIDPEEEHRAELQRKRIQRAEAVREELEQHYVALRAHFAMTGQQLQQTNRESAKTIDFLQHTVEQTATVLGLQRARLQIVRDCRDALKVRTEDKSGNDGSGCPMLAVWSSTEEELKTILKNKRKVTMNWVNTVEPTIPRNVPQYASVLSKLPNQCLGFAASDILGSNKSSMVYVSAPDPDCPLDESTASLEAEVAKLEHELQAEMNRNEKLLDKSAKARKSHDEWVAMISLVRQETEAVLHRHNVLLESDEVRDAIAVHQPEAGDDVDGDDEEEDDNNNADEDNSPEENVVDSVPGRKNQVVADDANEADDEGMVEEEDESEANGGKRGATSEDEPRKKRRKV